jgi:hypothetical protein
MRALSTSRWVVLGLCSVAAVAAETGEDRQLAITIYNDNLALIEHLRPLKLAAGRQRVEIPGVSAQILPQTVSFAAANLELMEQNFDYDLLTPHKLMEKAVGGNVRVVRTNPATGVETSETAQVLSIEGGTVLRIGNRIEVLRDDNLPARVVFDKVPDNLRARPTLSVLVNALAPVDQDVRLTYLSRGLGWAADYVAVFDEASGVLSMQGWITLSNRSGTGFANARAQLVAGNLNVTDPSADPDYRRGTDIQRRAGKEDGAQQRLADYYLYPLPHPTTIANQQTKQVSFLESDRVTASKGYEITFTDFASSDEPRSAEVRVRFANSKAAGLGAPLPAGVVRVYARDSRGQPQFIGEDKVGHTSGGSEIALRIGDAFDVTVTPTLNQTTRVNKRSSDYQMNYLVRNARAEAATVTVRQDGLWRFNEVRAESIKGRRTDADSFAWDVTVPPNGETQLTFTIRQGW